MKLIDKITTIWKNRKMIWQGIYFKYIKRSAWIEEVSSARMGMCKKCPSIDLTGTECIVPGTQPCCGICGCSLALKVYSLSSGCADEKNPKWNAVLTEEQEDHYKKIHKL